MSSTRADEISIQALSPFCVASAAAFRALADSDAASTACDQAGPASRNKKEMPIRPMIERFFRFKGHLQKWREFLRAILRPARSNNNANNMICINSLFRSYLCRRNLIKRLDVCINSMQQLLILQATGDVLPPRNESPFRQKLAAES